MGDDLYIAREFSNAALADISAMSALEPRHNNANIEQMSVKLTRLQSGAKRLHARAIYQSAQIVIDGLVPNAISQESFDSRLSALSKLVLQYASGLSEVENALAQEKLDGGSSITVDTAVSTRNENTPIKNQTPATKFAPQPSIEDMHLNAKTVLANLIPLTRAEESKALQSLIDYNPNIKTPEAPRVSSPQIPLEYVLRDAIQDALSIARMSGKTISISYDVGQTQINQDHRPALELRLCEGLRALIIQSLPQDGIGHIDVNLRGKNMVICSKYAPPHLLPHGLKSHKIANGCEIVFALSVDEKDAKEHLIATDKVVLDNIVSEPQAIIGSPMITAETEQQLRAQLGALMESQNVDEPMHMDDNIIVITDENQKKTKHGKHDKHDAGEIGVGL